MVKRENKDKKYLLPNQLAVERQDLLERFHDTVYLGVQKPHRWERGGVKMVI